MYTALALSALLATADPGPAAKVNRAVKADLAQLDPVEKVALEKLKQCGFDLEWETRQIVRTDGKPVPADQLPPPGINLSYRPNGGVAQRALVRTAKDLAPLADLRHVRRLGLAGTPVSDDTIGLLRNMSDLWVLDLSSTRVSDAGLKALAGLKKLASLRVGGTGITNKGLNTLAAFPALVDLSLRATKINDAGLAALAGHVRLETLDLGFTDVTDTCLTHLATLPQLHALGLQQTRITDKGLAAIAGPGIFRNLRWLDLADTRVSDKGLKLLQDRRALPHLRVLCLGNLQVTAEGIEALREARPGLRIINRVAKHAR